ncbi:MAG: DUF4292 domain-containing protein [Chitinophagales bacterium]
MYKHFILFVAALLFTGSVSAQVGPITLTDPVQVLTTDSAVNYDSLLLQIKQNEIPFKTLAVRTKLVWDDGKGEKEFMASIRIKRDSLVWASFFNAMGIEGARVLLTPDTFKLLNKLGNEYGEKDFNALRDWLMLPVTFEMLQQLLAGNKLSIQERAANANMQDSVYVLYAESDKLKEQLWVHPQSYTITKMVLKDKLLKQDMTLTFDAYNDLNGKPFAYKRGIEINRDGAVTKFSIEVTKVRLDEELEYPFEISNKYKRLE